MRGSPLIQEALRRLLSPRLDYMATQSWPTKYSGGSKDGKRLPKTLKILAFPASYIVALTKRSTDLCYNAFQYLSANHYCTID